MFFYHYQFSAQILFQCVTESLNQEGVYLQGELVEMGEGARLPWLWRLSDFPFDSLGALRYVKGFYGT